MKFPPFIAVVFVVIGIVLQTSCRTQQDLAHQQTPVGPVKNETPDTPVKNEPPQISEKWDETTAKEFLTISELRKKNPSSGIYETEGYVVDTVPDCDCPPHAKCKCAPASITISEQNEIPRSKELSNIELRILVSPDRFTSDRKYRFKVRIPGFDSEDEPLDEVFYVAHKAVKSDGENDENGALKVLSIRVIRETKPKPGIYKTTGFVNQINECPPCPPLMGCKPCRIGNSIRVSEDDENNTPRGANDLNEKEIFLLTESPSSFETGAKYSFKIKISDEKLPNYVNLRSINLIGFEKPKN